MKHTIKALYWYGDKAVDTSNHESLGAFCDHEFDDYEEACEAMESLEGSIAGVFYELEEVTV